MIIYGVFKIFSIASAIKKEKINSYFTICEFKHLIYFQIFTTFISTGLETFSQLLWKSDSGEVFVNETHIADGPRFKFRGVMIDTSRHFLPIDIIYDVIVS